MVANKCLSRFGVVLMLALVAFTAGCAKNQGRWVALETEKTYLEKALLDSNDVPDGLVPVDSDSDPDYGAPDEESLEDIGNHECSQAFWGLNADVMETHEPSRWDGSTFEGDESELTQVLVTFSSEAAAKNVTTDFLALPTDCASWDDTLYDIEVRYKHKVLEPDLVGDQIYATRTHLTGGPLLVVDRVIFREGDVVCVLQILQVGGRSEDVDDIVAKAYDELRNPDYPLFTFPRETEGREDEIEA
ncbi:MAG: hypothetical protein HOQ05_12630 [Corynebacteriales bacterium]|nr:hypothetical protein [Mycobacteriales bacterium]